MIRRPLVLALVVLALIPVGVPVASAASIDELDVPALDAKIERAQHHVHRWYRRIERWYERIADASARIERIERLVARDDGGTVGQVRRTVPRTGDPGFRLMQANRSLRRIMTGRHARHVQAQLDTWTAYVAELVRARELASRPSPSERSRPRGGGGLGLDHDGPVSYEAWAGAFLRHLDAPACDENLLIVVTWQTSESTSAAFNPLATTRDMPGATDMNSVGVKDYVSLRQGLDASRDTLLLGASSYGYGAIVESLRRCGSAEATARAINASAWCRGCVGGAYITGLLPIVRATYAEHAARLISVA